MHFFTLRKAQGHGLHNLFLFFMMVIMSDHSSKFHLDQSSFTCLCVPGEEGQETLKTLSRACQSTRRPCNPNTKLMPESALSFLLLECPLVTTSCHIQAESLQSDVALKSLFENCHTKLSCLAVCMIGYYSLSRHESLNSNSLILL